VKIQLRGAVRNGLVQAAGFLPSCLLHTGSTARLRWSPEEPARLLYVEHVAEHGIDLFRAACEMDLEGIVAKLGDVPYGTEPISWIKVKNEAYSQAVGRWERFGGMPVSLNWMNM
jgi:hypothetical protein